MSNEPAVDPTVFTYLANHHILCDGQEYHAGDEFTHSDPARIKELRAAGAISLREERMRADEIATQLAAREAELAQLRAENERLRASGVSPSGVPASAGEPAAPAAPATGGGKPGKASASSSAAGDESK